MLEQANILRLVARKRRNKDSDIHRRCSVLVWMEKGLRKHIVLFIETFLEDPHVRHVNPRYLHDCSLEELLRNAGYHEY